MADFEKIPSAGVPRFSLDKNLYGLIRDTRLGISHESNMSVFDLEHQPVFQYDRQTGLLAFWLPGEGRSSDYSRYGDYYVFKPDSVGSPRKIMRPDGQPVSISDDELFERGRFISSDLNVLIASIESDRKAKGQIPLITSLLFIAVLIGAGHVLTVDNNPTGRSTAAVVSGWRAVQGLVASSSPDQASSTTIKLGFVGDIMMDRSVEIKVDKVCAGDFHCLFTNFQPESPLDILVGNLEGPVSDKGRDGGSLYSFRMRPAALEALRDSRFNVLSVANNHALDWGRAAFEDSLDRLTGANILAIGGGFDKADAEKLKVVEVGDRKVAFVGFSDVSGSWMVAGDNQSGLNISSQANVERLIKKAKQESDLVVAIFHFGDEYQPVASSRQWKLAHLAVDSGAQIVIGHHPHVVQDEEYYNGGYIAYSLGNFIFDQYFSVPTMSGRYVEISWAGGEIKSVAGFKTSQNKDYQIESMSATIDK